MSDRLRSGHAPLDDILAGGLPANAITLIAGLPGTGKTVLAQLYVFSNARPDRPAVYFSTVSEPLEKIVRFGQSLDFFDRAAVGSSVFFEDLGAIAGSDGLAGITERIATVLKERRPGLVVIDSFKALHAFTDSLGDFRDFLYQLTGMLSALAVSSLWVGEYEAAEIGSLAEFAVADAILSLSQGIVRHSGAGRAARGRLPARHVNTPGRAGRLREDPHGSPFHLQRCAPRGLRRDCLPRRKPGSCGDRQHPVPGIRILTGAALFAARREHDDDAGDSRPLHTERLSESYVSHLSDNVVLLSYIRVEDSISRTIAVIKSRASHHQPTIREFAIDPHGITLADGSPRNS